MVFNWFNWEKDTVTAKIHPTQKPVPLLKKLIQIFTDVGDVVIDPVAGSASTLMAAVQLGRSAYGFEIKKDFYLKAKAELDRTIPDLIATAKLQEIEATKYKYRQLRMGD